MESRGDYTAHRLVPADMSWQHLPAAGVQAASTKLRAALRQTLRNSEAVLAALVQVRRADFLVERTLTFRVRTIRTGVQCS